MPLEQYNAKRNFKKTPEPVGKPGSRRGKALSFVVQKHDASRLHYDFRLELNGVLLSWAVPKGPSLDPTHKSLAVQVEDHPLTYGGFEGTIPAGEYGGGTVAVWDRGTWSPIGDARDGLKAGKLSFTLDGERLRGEWTLVRLRGGKNWLLMKKKDDYATAKPLDVDDSVVTGRSLDEIANGGAAAPKKRRQSATPLTTGSRASKKDRVSRANAAVALPVISPQLAVLADEPPSGKNWRHEIKYDGYRLIASLQNKNVILRTRNGHDWTNRFPSLADSLAKLPAKTAIIDGEAVVLDAQGRSDFQALQMMLKEKEKARPVFFAFDLLYLDGADLRDAPLQDRAGKLHLLLKKAKLPENIRLSEQLEAPGDDVLKQACRLGLEGMISKKVDAPYVSRRDPSWLKIKCGQRQEFVIVGFTEPNRSRVGLGALLLGYHDDQKRLVYAGRVGTGFDTKLLGDLRKTLEKLAEKTSPLDIDAPARERRSAYWVRPELVAEVSFTGWTRDGMLRHPVFVALRSDKPAESITRETPLHTKRLVREKASGIEPSGAPAKGPASAAKSAKGVVVAGVTLSHPDKILFPEARITKRDLAEYMQLVSKWMLPHVIDRPLALVRCPAGRGQKCFFQRNFTDALPDDLQPVDVGENGKKDEHISLNTERGLISLVQMGVLEIHTWNCKANDVETPDQLVFDLDPADDVAWKDVVAGARTVRRSLEGLGLPVFLKTSGGKGFHLVVPLRPTIDWETAKSFSGDIARALSQESKLFVANMRKDLRKGRIYIDFHRNGRSSTSVAPYSTRARDGAPVSMPISWEELGKLTSASQFTVDTARRYLMHRRSDPWQAFGRSRVDLRKYVHRSTAD